MNAIKPEKWSPEWYEITTTEKLITMLTEAKHSLPTGRGGKPSVRHLWQERLQRLNEELARRETEWDETEKAVTSTKF